MDYNVGQSMVVYKYILLSIESIDERSNNMRKNLKALVSLILAVVMVLAATCTSFATISEGRTITNVNEAYKLVREVGFLGIYKATLKVAAQDPQEVYYIVCKGLDFTETDMSQPRSLANAIKIGLSSENNTYVTTLVDTVRANCTENLPLVFVGHSMGGMVIEQAISKSEIKDNYEVLYALAIGSPYIITKNEKEGRLIRTIDNCDPIAYMSIPLLSNPFVGEVKTESSMKLGLIHFRSYEEGSCWKKYDALGIRKGGSTVTINQAIYEEDGNRICFY